MKHCSSGREELCTLGLPIRSDVRRADPRVCSGPQPGAGHQREGL